MKRTILLFVILSSLSITCYAQDNASVTSSSSISTTTDTTTLFASTSWAPKVKTILTQSKAEMGGTAWDHIHSLRIEGTYKLGGLSGSVTRLTDFSTGRWTKHINLGPIKIAKGFNGKFGWKKKSNGKAVALNKPAAMKFYKTIAITKMKKPGGIPNAGLQKLNSLV